MGRIDFPAKKIEDDELRQLAIEGQDSLVSVLVIPELPAPTVVFERGDDARRSSYPVGFAPETPERRAERERTIEQTRRNLTELLGEKPPWLDAPKAFVVDATGPQLREIARLQSVRAIQPNYRRSDVRISSPLGPVASPRAGSSLRG
jgi:hypothetical protein